MAQISGHTRHLVLRKAVLVIVIVLCSGFGVYIRGPRKALSIDPTDGEENSFYFLSSEQTDQKQIAKVDTTKQSISLNLQSFPQPIRVKRSIDPNAPPPNCTPPAYKEFPPDLFGQWLRARGFIIIHIIVACYMFFCLAVVCDRHFLPSLELCAQSLGLSNDVAGATFMAAGSSAPELFTAILGVFIAKSDVGTGTIVGSAVFNILFVIGICATYSASVQLNWWPVARDSSYYCLTVLVLIFVSFDGRISTMESAFMLVLYIGYILTMHFNERLHCFVLAQMEKYSIPMPASHIPADQMPYQDQDPYSLPAFTNTLPPSRDPYKMSLLQAAHHVILQHKRLFRPHLRFRSAGNLIILRNNKLRQAAAPTPAQQHPLSAMRPPSMSTEQLKEYWRTPPNFQVQGFYVYAKWVLIAPLYAVLHYTIPDCKLKPSLFLVSFSVSVFWIAVFSYIMVWMVTIIGYTFSIPDSIMGITLLAAGTSVPDAYTSLHVASQGQGDMAVSNSIGSNVFDILVGLALPWFVETSLVYPGTVAAINSRGLFYAIVLLFLSLVTTIILFHKHGWVLNPRLGTALLICYGIFLFVCSILEFNVIDVSNPGMCEE